MIKRHEIIKSYQVILYCDNCNAQMKFNGFDITKELYEYICPKCGNIQYSKEMLPYVINSYKTEGEIIG